MQQSRPGKSRLIVSFKVIRLSCDGDDLISGCFRFLFLLYPHVWSANIFNASDLLDSFYLRTTQDLEETEWLKLTEKPLCLMVQYIIMHSFVDLIIATYVSVPIEPASLSEKKCLCLSGGSEEKKPGEEQHKDGDASGSKDSQTQSSSEDGKVTFVFFFCFFEKVRSHSVLQVSLLHHCVPSCSHFVCYYFQTNQFAHVCLIQCFSACFVIKLGILKIY